MNAGFFPSKDVVNVINKYIHNPL